MKTHSAPGHLLGVFSPLQQWLASWEIHDTYLAHFLCWLIPAQCPFARTIKCGDRVLFEIPPLCKLNPFYDSLMELRFKSLVYLECTQDNVHHLR
ncbi:MAG: Mo-dependent nitrogenase C-terminal domain-containing protein [Cyanobacteria bacterium J06641_5]